MKKLAKVASSVFFLFALGAFFSCKSNKNDVSVYEPVDYTEEDALKNEIDRINNMHSSEPVKALWRANVLSLTVQNDDRVASLKKENEKYISDLYYSSIKDNQYQRAFRLYSSLKSINSSYAKDIEKSSGELKDVLSREVTLYDAQSEWDGKMSSLINGTVTVYVDRGMKVQSGYATPDAVLGSGFFISRNGYIVTNHHVIASCVDPEYEGYAKLYIKLAQDTDTRIPARVIGYDKVLDLALLKTEVEAPYVFALGSSEDLDVGDRVYAIGSPLGLERTLTSGVISSTDRDLFMLGKVFQIDAAVNSGNSGGPLVDQKGRVQAIVFAGVQNYQGLNFAIPVEYLKSELSILFNGGKRSHPWIEAYGKTLKAAGVNSKSEGVEIQYVIPGGSAYLSGLKGGDVIIAINDESITSLDELHLKLMQMLHGTMAKLRVVDKDYNERDVVVYFAERPDYPGYSVYTHDLIKDAMVPLLGMELVNSSTENSKVYSVKKVYKASSAEELGFSEGDIVQIVKTVLSDDKSALGLVLSTQKNKSGYLSLSIAITVPFDSPYYF